MGDVFHGWRRKAGCVTLLMACVSAAALIRSLSIHDQFSVVTGRSIREVGSVNQHLFFSVFREVPPFPTWTITNPFGIWTIERFETFDDFTESITWTWKFCGIAGVSHTAAYTILHISYWSIVIPLILLSAYLLLSKPQQPKSRPAQI